MQLGKDECGNFKTFSYDESACRKRMVDYIIRAEQPFNMMETDDYSKTIQTLINHQFKGWSGNTVKRDIMKKFQTERENLKQYFANFEGKICLTSDIWTSLMHRGFLCITAHYIDSEWMLNKRIISSKTINTPHNDTNISTLINYEIIDFGIHDKIFTITLDNASNNNVAIQRLKRFCQINDDHAKLFHVRCCAHILNLTVKDGLKQVDSTLEKIRDIAYNINCSRAKHELFFYCCKIANMKRKNISLDIPTRWNSTYKLLQNITKYKKVVQLYEMQLSKNNNNDVDQHVLNDYDWHIADLLRYLFEIFDTSTNIFCSVYYPTSHRVSMQITSIYMVLQNYLSYEIFNDTIFAMIEKIKKYWGEIPLIYYIGLIVDPRLKFDTLDEWLPIIYNEDQIKNEEIKNEVNSLLYILYNIYKEKYGNNISLIKSSSTTSSSSFYKSPLEMFKSRKKATTSSPNNTTDIDRYLSVETIPFEDNEAFDILEWWEKQQIKYLVLSIIARDVLTVPVSTVASEAAFSAGGRVVSKKRCNLSPQAIEAVVCLKDWSLADKRLHDHVREAGLVADTENLKI